MFDLESFLAGLVVIAIAVFATWIVGIAKSNVSVVDTLWPLLFLALAATYRAGATHPGPRASLVIVLVALWALRLAAYLTWRNWGEPEDRRYRAIRRRNEPGFALKSLYLIFGLQGALAWVISLPLLAGIAAPGPLNTLDTAGAVLWTLGFAFESVADAQLACFKRLDENRGRVLDRGLWRYTRHPNYFGDFCVWWGFFLMATAAGGWWSIPGPLLMSLLLLRVSGVALLEKDIAERRPAYRAYASRTNAFFPGIPRQAAREPSGRGWA